MFRSKPQTSQRPITHSANPIQPTSVKLVWVGSHATPIQVSK